MDNIQFKPRAYEKAAISIEALEQDLEQIYLEGGVKALKQLPGIGESIAEKIEELIKTGKLQYYEELQKKVPVDLESFEGIEELGPKKIKVLYKQLKIKNMDNLEKAALQHKISKLPGFKVKTEQNILKGIDFAKRSQGRFILGFNMSVIRGIETMLKSMPEIQKIVPAGAVRRMKETIGDVDFLVQTKNSGKVMDFFVSSPKSHQSLKKAKLNPQLN